MCVAKWLTTGVLIKSVCVWWVLYSSTRCSLYCYEWFLKSSSIMSPFHPPPLVPASSNAELGKHHNCVQSHELFGSMPVMVQGYASVLGCAVSFYYSQAAGNQLRQTRYPRIPKQTSQVSPASILFCFTGFTWWLHTYDRAGQRNALLKGFRSLIESQNTRFLLVW